MPKLRRIKYVHLTVDEELYSLLEQYKKLYYDLPDATICRMLIYQALNQLHGLK